ncbi:HTTM domain-containing protein [Natronomonas sp.]|uniref:HTTM domain-containing protein n=1 Tax=Natronomonas sp. TaxID=2184060 RepID=UPI003988E774
MGWTRSDAAGRLRAATERRLGIDTRALSAFRIAAAFLLLADLLLRARDMTAFYTDAGVFPRAALAESFPTLSRLSLHAVSGSLWVQAVLFGIAFGFAVLLLVGYRTRLVAAVSWLLLASLQARNYFVLNGGDTVLLVVLFIALFLPLGERWSLDALAADRTDADHTKRVTDFATVAILTQVVLVYTTNAAFKLQGGHWLDGTAVRHVFELERFTVFLGEYLAAFPRLLVAINWLWLTMLVAAPLLFVLTGWLRALTVAVFAAAHTGMLLTMSLGLFPLVMMACLLLFLPPCVWNSLESRVAVTETEIVSRTPGFAVDYSPLLPHSARRAISRAVPAVTATILVVGLLWQAAAVGIVATPQESSVNPEEQSWKLFAPGPPETDGWYVVPAELESGERVHVYPHSDTGWNRPDDIGDTYPNARWRKYLTRMRLGGETQQRYFAAYLCSNAADSHGENIAELTIYYVSEPVTLDADEPQRTRRSLGTYQCPVDG